MNHIINKLLTHRFNYGLANDLKVILESKQIAITRLKSNRFVIDYTATGGHFISATTSQHVCKIKREAGVKVISAEEYHEGFHHLVRDL